MPGRNVSNERGQRNVSNDRGKRNVSNDRGKRNAAGKVRSHQPRSAGKSGKNSKDFFVCCQVVFNPFDNNS